MFSPWPSFSSASHQSGHNSGVIHTGIYYTPGTLKAKLCVRGADLMYQYCDKRKIPYKNIGKVSIILTNTRIWCLVIMYLLLKVIVAVNDNEVPTLKNLFDRGITNKVKGLKLIGPKELQEIEPYCKV